MRGHITSQELHLVADGAVAAESLLEISHHLGACDLCAQRAGDVVDLDALAGAMRNTLSPDEHPVTSDLAAYVDDGLDAAARDWVDEHLQSCARCREDVADLRSEQMSLRAGWHAWQWIAAGILIAGVIGGGTMWLLSGSRPEVIHRGSTHLVRRLPPKAPPQDAWSELERSVLAAARIDPPSILGALRPAAQTLRGSEAAVGRELHPAGEVIEEDRPPFVWTATPGAKYVVMVFSGEEPVATSEPLSDAQWKPSQALHRGTTYSWQVETRHADGTSVLTPAPPQPEALFRITDAETLAEIATARRAHPDDDLLLAILYARAGMKARALAELQSHLASHPSDARAAALADSIRRW
jgi:anti-sigma factor RsiW